MDNRPHSFRIGFSVGGGLAPNGDPIPETVEWGKLISCRYGSVSTLDLRNTPNGIITECKYYIFTGNPKLNLIGQTIRVYGDKKGNELVIEGVVKGRTEGKQVNSLFYL